MAAVTRTVEGWHRPVPRRTRRLITSGGGSRITPCVVRRIGQTGDTDDDTATTLQVQLLLWDTEADEAVLQLKDGTPGEGEEQEYFPNPWFEAQCWFTCKGRHYRGMVTTATELDDKVTVTWLVDLFGKQWVMPFVKMGLLTIERQSDMRVSDCNPIIG